MAKKRSIGAIIKLDGENAFKSSVKNCRSSLAAMRAELKNIQASYSGNANSLEALSAVQSKYAEMQSTARNQVEKMSTAYEKSREAQQKTKETMMQMLDAYQKAEVSLKEMKNSGEASADAINEQQEAVDAAYKAYQDYAEQVEKCGSRTAYFQKALEDAKGEERKAGEAVNRYASYIDEAKESVDGCSHSIDEFGDVVTDSGDAAGTAGNAMSVFAGVVGGNIATAGLEKVCDLLKRGAEYAVEVGSGLEASLSKVQALSGANSSEMKELKETAEDLGRVSKAFNSEDISDAFGFMALAGWDVRQQLAAIPGVINLATASEMDLAEASDMVTDNLTAFGLSADYAGKMADMLAYAQSHSNATTAQFGDAWKNSAANLNAAGQSMKTSLAFLEAFANMGVKSERAGTQLAAIVRDLTKKMSDGAIQIGNTTIAVQDSAGNFRDLIDIMEDVEKATDGMGTAQRSEALAAVFTDDSIKGVNMSLQEGIGNIRNYREQLEDCDGAASDMADTMSDNLKGAMASASSAANGLGDAVYDYVKGPLKSMFNGIADELNKITDAITPQKTELESFVEEVEEANEKVKDMMSSADIQYNESTTDANKIKAYIDTMTELYKKQNLTEFETYQLNEAVTKLSSTMPQFNDYVGDTNKLLALTPKQFEKMADSAKQSYKEVLKAAAMARSSSYMQAKAEAEINKKMAQSAIDETEKEIKKSEAKLEKLQNDYMKNGNHTPGEKIAYEDELESLRLKQQDLSDTLVDSKKALKTAKEEYSEAEKSCKEFNKANEDLYNELGLIVDKSGDVVDAVNNDANAADKAKKANDDLKEGVEGVGDAYVDASGKVSNSNIATAIQSQMTAAAENIDNFKDSVKNAFSSFSLFGDTEGLMDIYTTSNKTQMEKNAKISLDIMGKYADELKSLSDRGLSDEFIGYLTDQGQAGLEYVHGLASWTSDAELQQFQKQFDSFNSYAKGTNEKVSDIMNSYTENIMDGVQGGYKAWYDYGIQSTQGLLDAIEAAKVAMQAEDFSGDFNDAMNTLLNSKRQTVLHTQPINENTHTRLSSAPSNANTKTRDMPDITVNVKMAVDGEELAGHVTKTIKNNNNISGRR